MLFMALSALAGLSVAGMGCGRSPLEPNVYRSGSIAFRTPDPPTSWKSLHVPDASMAFRDEAHDASALVNARCATLDTDTPLTALTLHLLIGTTEREIAEQAVEAMDGREALHTRLTAKLDGVPRAFDVFVLKKDGCVYDFVYVGAPRAVEPGIPEFQAFVRGFHTLRGSGAP